MTKKQLSRAAKIFALANTYHSLDGSDCGDESFVAVAAKAWAENELAKMGIDPSQVLSPGDAIAVSNDKLRGCPVEKG
jgi:hypothetical protein